MKENLKLFWENTLNNKYYVCVALFILIGVGAICTKNDFVSVCGFWFMLGFSLFAVAVVLIGDWLTKNSQK